MRLALSKKETIVNRPGHLTDRTPIIGTGDYLVLTNIYPSYDDLYRNAFVHARVKAYEKEGLNMDVIRVRKGMPLYYYEFDGVDVVSGSTIHLKKLLEANKYKAIAVHFLDEDMWSVLEKFIKDVKIYVWVHGSEIQNWKRRDYNYSNEEERKEAIIASDRRDVFWRRILDNPHPNLKLIFVSQYFADEVMEDLGISIPKRTYEVIHNYINTDLFAYKKKDATKRTKVLSIRPFASNKYANDLSVKAVLKLKNKEFFKELEFRFIGDGVLFDETLEPIRGLDNVVIEKGFLQQKDIAALHKEHGIFLVPTRMDAQGVSRDEAMSSGLVPITNNVAAIPEFVDKKSGILAEADDSDGLAAGIELLYKNPDIFSKMSKAASDRVASQSGYKQTILKEVKLISGEKKQK